MIIVIICIIPTVVRVVLIKNSIIPDLRILMSACRRGPSVGHDQNHPSKINTRSFARGPYYDLSHVYCRHLYMYLI